MSARKIKLVPLGEWPHPSGAVQVVDAEAVAAMADGFPADGILVDFDHYSDLDEAQRRAVEDSGILLPSDAAGWVRKAWAEADGLWGELEPTPEGEKALASKKYRYHSPVFPLRGLVPLGEKRVRPTRIGKVGLTNEPNIGGVPALANRGGDAPLLGPPVDLAAIDVNAAAFPPETNPDPEKEIAMDYKTKLLAVLGLPADATDASAQAHREDQARDRRGTDTQNQVGAPACGGGGQGGGARKEHSHQQRRQARGIRTCGSPLRQADG